jgi:hypothetical protein
VLESWMLCGSNTASWHHSSKSGLLGETRRMVSEMPLVYHQCHDQNFPTRRAISMRKRQTVKPHEQQRLAQKQRRFRLDWTRFLKPAHCSDSAVIADLFLAAYGVSTREKATACRCHRFMFRPPTALTKLSPTRHSTSALQPV